MDSYDNDPIDRKKIGKYFPEIFNAFSHTEAGKHSFIMNIKNNYAYWSTDSVDYFGLDGIRIYNPIEKWEPTLLRMTEKNFLKICGGCFQGSCLSIT